MRRKRFSPRTYAEIIERQGGKCGCGCRKSLGTDPRNIRFDHCIPLWNGGADSPDNLQALLPRHHRAKTSQEATARAKVKRIAERDGLRKPRMSQRDKVLAKYLETSPRPA